MIPHAKSKIRLFLSTLLFGLVSHAAIGQSDAETTWYDASSLSIHGKLDSAGTAAFQRFPSEIKGRVRDRVWKLSENSAGLYIEFRTDATKIEFRYGVDGELSFAHMPATGVSGLDLYAHTGKEDWKWIRGIYSFKDTISYRFANIRPTGTKNLRPYRLYLPLYNGVQWMQIGVPENAVFKNLDLTEKEPIVIYGTSIVQGACASRPGMAWPSLLGRKSGRPVVNLGFSGNGRLESEIIEFVANKKASLYILDCMANFTSGQGLNPEEAETRLIKAVNDIRTVRPSTPILLVEHAGYSDGDMQPARKDTYTNLNEATRRAYKKLMATNEKQIYLLERTAIGLNGNSFVDGTHPNDYGMLQYANAMANKIAAIEASVGTESESTVTKDP